MDLSLLEWQRAIDRARSRRGHGLYRLGKQPRRLLQNARLLLFYVYDNRRWWERDIWSPPHDPRIPVLVNEPNSEHAVHLWGIEPEWFKEAVRWTWRRRLESGEIRWSTIRSQNSYFRRFSQYLEQNDINDPLLGATPADARRVFLDFRAALQSDVVTRGPNVGSTRTVESTRGALSGALQLYAYVAREQDDAARDLSHPRWGDIDERWGLIFRRGDFPREKRSYQAFRDQVVLPEVMTQILKNVHVLGDPADEGGLNDPQAERLMLLIAKLGRRINEYIKIAFDCLEPVLGIPTRTPDDPGEISAPAAYLRYNQTKIEGAPDRMLIDAETVAVIHAQQQWVRDFYAERGLAHITPRFLWIPTKHGQLSGDRAYSTTTLYRRYEAFAKAIDLRDDAGRAVRITRSHKFRHTRGTTLAMMGVPLKVIQRDLGHFSPVMSAHYIAMRDEDAEQAFYATKKYDARGRELEVANRDLWHLMQLDQRADRILPNGWCLLPPLETCGRGNACLTCNVYATDVSHRDELERQLQDTSKLIESRRQRFLERRGSPMPESNVWLSERLREVDALQRVLAELEAASPAGQDDLTTPLDLYIVGGGVVARDAEVQRRRPSA